MLALSKSEIQLLEFMKHTGLSASESAWVLTGSVSEQGLPNRTLHISAPFRRQCRHDSQPIHHKVIILGPAAQDCVSKILAFNKERGLPTDPASPLFQDSRGFPLSIRSVVAYQKANEVG